MEEDRSILLPRGLSRDESRRLVGQALEGLRHPLQRCLGCGIIAVPSHDNVHEIHTTAGILGDRKFFFCVMVIGTEGGTLLPMCTQCMAKTHEGLAVAMRRR